MDGAQNIRMEGEENDEEQNLIEIDSEMLAELKNDSFVSSKKQFIYFLL